MIYDLRGDSAQRCRVSRNGVPQAGGRKGDGRRGKRLRQRHAPPRRPSPPPVPSGGPHHSAANAVSCGIPCILGRTSAAANAVEPSQCGGSTSADILTHLARRKSPTSRQGRKPGRAMRHTANKTSRRDDTLSVIPAGHGCEEMLSVASLRDAK